MKYYLKKRRGLLFLTVLLSIAESLGSVFIAILIQKILDIAVSGDAGRFGRALMGSLLYFILLGIFSFLYSLVSKKLVCEIMKSIRNKSFAGMIGHSYPDFQKTSTADYLSALTNDVKIIEDNYLLALLTVIQYGIIFAASTVVMFYFDIIIAIYVLGAILLMLVVPGLFGAAIQKKQEQYSNSLSEFTGNLKDMLSGFEVIKSYSMRSYTLTRFQKSNKATIRAKYSVDKVMSANEAVSALLGIFVQISAIFLSAYFIINGRITVGALVGIIQATGMMVQPLMMIFQNAPKIKGARPVIQRLNVFSEYEDSSFNGRINPTFEKSLQIRNLVFSYSKEKQILKDVCVDIQKGMKYALVGKNGCGKSTLVKLCCGYYPDYQGEILYDNWDLAELNYDELITLSATIHQDVYMFNESIYDNICLHCSYADSEIDKALEISGVSGFINSLPNGLDTLAEENGANLSGGQKQRIAVARAIIQNKPILILDEGTSAIDMQTAYDIEGNLLNIKELTVITITHNLQEENLKRYDQIIYMDDGTICEIGSYEELIKKQEGFYDFSQLNKDNRAKMNRAGGII